MSKFSFRAKDWSGKLIRGSLELSSREEVLESIRSSGLIPLKIAEEKENIFLEITKKLFYKVGLKQITTFTRQLSTMLTAGLPLTDALSLLKAQSKGNTMMAEIMNYTLDKVRGGQSLGTALEKYRNNFGEAYVASIKAGEEGGVLEEVLSKLADSMEGENEFRGKVKGAMVYPMIVIIGMILVAIVMMVLVIPKLLVMYKDFGTAKMPPATRILMAISDGMVKVWFLFPIAAIGGYVLLKAGNKSEKFRLKKDKLMLKIPIIGELSQKTIVANTTRTLSMLLTAGISLVEALKIVAKVADNELYNQAYMKIAERVQKGFTIASSFEETGVFPMIINQMVETGEATGKLDEVLMKVSKYFSTEAEQTVKTLTSAIEPLIMIVLGAGVLFLVIAVIMPIYNLTSSF